MKRLRSDLKVGQVRQLGWLLMGQAVEVEASCQAAYRADRVRTILFIPPGILTPTAAKISGSSFFCMGVLVAPEGRDPEDPRAFPVYEPAYLNSSGVSPVPYFLIRIAPGKSEQRVLPQHLLLPDSVILPEGVIDDH